MLHTGTLALSLAATLVASPAQAQGAYPNRPLRIIVPLTTGGSNDVLARIIAQKLHESWGQPVLVENRPGASTLIGTTAVAKSPADGYTLIVSVSNHTTNPAMRDKMPYDTLKDFVGISLMARTAQAVCVHPSVQVTTIQEFLAYVRARPGEINFSSAGIGATGQEQDHGLGFRSRPFGGACELVAVAVRRQDRQDADGGQLVSVAIGAPALFQRTVLLQLFQQAFQFDPAGILDAEGLGDVALGRQGRVIGDPLQDLLFRGDLGHALGGSMPQGNRHGGYPMYRPIHAHGCAAPRHRRKATPAPCKMSQDRLPQGLPCAVAWPGRTGRPE